VFMQCDLTLFIGLLSAWEAIRLLLMTLITHINLVSVNMVNTQWSYCTIYLHLSKWNNDSENIQSHNCQIKPWYVFMQCDLTLFIGLLSNNKFVAFRICTPQGLYLTLCKKYQIFQISNKLFLIMKCYFNICLNLTPKSFDLDMERKKERKKEIWMNIKYYIFVSQGKL
jgi:hypothetical protein